MVGERTRVRTDNWAALLRVPDHSPTNVFLVLEHADMLPCCFRNTGTVPHHDSTETSSEEGVVGYLGATLR